MGTMELIPIALIDPLGLPNDEERRDHIQQSMEMYGWNDRPLLVVSVKETKRYQALTGSHRFDAARWAGLSEIPALVIDGQQLRDAGIILENLAHTLSDEGRVIVLGDAGQDEAVACIQREIDANKEDWKRKAEQLRK